MCETHDCDHTNTGLHGHFLFEGTNYTWKVYPSRKQGILYSPSFNAGGCPFTLKVGNFPGTTVKTSRVNSNMGTVTPVLEHAINEALKKAEEASSPIIPAPEPAPTPTTPEEPKPPVPVLRTVFAPDLSGRWGVYSTREASVKEVLRDSARPEDFPVKGIQVLELEGKFYKLNRINVYSSLEDKERKDFIRSLTPRQRELLGGALAPFLE